MRKWKCYFNLTSVSTVLDADALAVQSRELHGKEVS